MSAIQINSDVKTELKVEPIASTGTKATDPTKAIENPAQEP